jgi:haloalkane dehalogenase
VGLKQKPVSLFWGDKDWCFTPSFRQRFEREFPAAEVHAWADCGHYVVEDAHERILPLLRTFLDRHSGFLDVSNPGVAPERAAL